MSNMSNMSNMKLMPLKQNVRNILPYSVPVEFDGVKLNQNESPLDLPAEVKEEICGRLQQRTWNRYPGLVPDGLIRKISGYTGYPAEGIMVGSGSNELIQTLIYGCCNSGDKLLTIAPTFSVYQRVAEVMNIGTLSIPLKPDFSFDVPALTAAASQQVNIIVLGNPNNPTGTMIGQDHVRQIAENTNALLVMDEAYFEFSGQSCLSLIRQYPNLVVLRTFSKALRAPGLRLGYLLGDPQLVRELEKLKLPFSLSMVQQIAGEVIMEQRSWLEKSVETTLSERERMFNQLLQIPGIEPVRSKANFILFRSRVINASELFNYLLSQGVLIRLFNDQGQGGLLRISIGTFEENDLFLGCVKSMPPAAKTLFEKRVLDSQKLL